jgi:histidinol-phosphate aminotransferase
MMIRSRAHLVGLEPVHHGGVTDAELASFGLDQTEIIDFSVNTNPLGPPSAAVAAARQLTWATYPDDGAMALRDELARRDGVDEREVVVGNGSVELIWLVALAFLDPGDHVVVVGPTFGEYARAARVVGCPVHVHYATQVDDFAVDVDAIIARVRTVAARIIFLCNPNNPTGVLLPMHAISRLAHAVPWSLLVVDEAYRQLSDEPAASASLLSCGNVVLLRSLTKDYALPGLRLGYVLAAASVSAALDQVRPPWSVNAVAQAAGLAALADEEHLTRARSEVRRARAVVSAGLTALGWRVLPSVANYLLVEVGDARTVRSALLRQGVCVRDCTSFGLPRHVRIGLRTVAECERLVAAFAAPGLRERTGAQRG